MPVLLGEYECSMDAKGRLRIPTPLLRQFGEQEKHSFILNRGVDKHLTLFPREVWEKEKIKIDALNTYNADARKFRRVFYSGATEIEVDDQGRILLPKRLVEYAEIEKEVVLFAINDRVEIWSLDEYDAMMNDDTEDLSELAAKVLGNSLTDLP